MWQPKKSDMLSLKYEINQKYEKMKTLSYVKKSKISKIIKTY